MSFILEHKLDFAHLTLSERKKKSGKDAYLEKSSESLCVRIKKGEHLAAGELVDQYYKQIFLFMRRLGHSIQASEDLTQECFMQVWRHIGQLRSDSAIKGWIYSIAGNASRRYWRRNKIRATVSLDEISPCEHLELDSNNAEKLEEFGKLRKAIFELPEKLRQAVILHYMQHLTISEAAGAAGIKQGTFKSRLSRALKQLRKQLTAIKQDLDNE